MFTQNLHSKLDYHLPKQLSLPVVPLVLHFPELELHNRQSQLFVSSALTPAVFS